MDEILYYWTTVVVEILFGISSRVFDRRSFHPPANSSRHLDGVDLTYTSCWTEGSSGWLLIARLLPPIVVVGHPFCLDVCQTSQSVSHSCQQEQLLDIRSFVACVASSSWAGLS